MVSTEALVSQSTQMVTITDKHKTQGDVRSSVALTEGGGDRSLKDFPVKFVKEKNIFERSIPRGKNQPTDQVLMGTLVLQQSDEHASVVNDNTARRISILQAMSAKASRW